MRKHIKFSEQIVDENSDKGLFYGTLFNLRIAHLNRGWAGFSIRHTTVRHHAAHGVDGTRAVDHALSAVGGWNMGTEEWALITLSHADFRHHASHGVNVARTGDHALSAVHGWHRRAMEGTLFTLSNTGLGHHTAH